jgi:hypothetical protein
MIGFDLTPTRWSLPSVHLWINGMVGKWNIEYSGQKEDNGLILFSNLRHEYKNRSHSAEPVLQHSIIPIPHGIQPR